MKLECHNVVLPSLLGIIFSVLTMGCGQTGACLHSGGPNGSWCEEDVPEDHCNSDWAQNFVPVESLSFQADQSCNSAESNVTSSPGKILDEELNFSSSPGQSVEMPEVWSGSEECKQPGGHYYCGGLNGEGGPISHCTGMSAVGYNWCAFKGQCAFKDGKIGCLSSGSTTHCKNVGTCPSGARIEFCYELPNWLPAWECGTFEMWYQIKGNKYNFCKNHWWIGDKGSSCSSQPGTEFDCTNDFGVGVDREQVGSYDPDAPTACDTYAPEEEEDPPTTGGSCASALSNAPIPKDLITTKCWNQFVSCLEKNNCDATTCTGVLSKTGCVKLP